MLKYKVIEELGRGGMGVVYRVDQVELRRQVAMKVLIDDSAIQERHRIRFEREIEACIRLNHPHVIKIFDYGEQNGNLYYTMELLEAKALVDLIDETGPQPVDLILRVLVQVADALAYCHSHGLVHRDVKPHNIMLKSNGDAVLMDFGLIRQETENTLTQEGALVGTPRFLAPEVVVGHGASPASDVFALGLTAYEMAIGRAAYGSFTDLKGLLMSILKDTLPTIREIRPDFPIEVDEFIQKTLVKDPAKRLDTRETWKEARALVEHMDPRRFASMDDVHFAPSTDEIDPAVLEEVEREIRASRSIRLNLRESENPEKPLPGSAPRSESGSFERMRQTQRIRKAASSSSTRPEGSLATEGAGNRILVIGSVCALIFAVVAMLFVFGGAARHPKEPVVEASHRPSVTKFRVETITAREARVVFELDSEPRSPLTYTLENAQTGLELARGTVTGKDRVTIRNLEPHGKYRVYFLHEGQRLPGVDSGFTHPEVEALQRRDHHASERDLRIWFESWVPHRYQIHVLDRVTKSLLFKDETEKPVQRYWRLVDGVHPNREYSVDIEILDEGYYLYNGKCVLKTKSLEWRRGIEDAFDDLHMPIQDQIAAGRLYNYEDARTVQRIVDMLKNRDFHDKDSANVYKFLVHTLGETGKPDLADALIEIIDDAPTPEHELRGFNALSYLGSASKFETVLARLKKRFSRETDERDCWRGQELLAPTMVSIDADKASAYATKVAADASSLPLAERVVASEILISGPIEAASAGLGILSRKDPDWRMQVLALGHLGRVGTSAAREQIRMTLKSLGASGDHRVLRTALVMLGSTGEAADLDLILPFARGGVAADVFRNALIALGLIACEQGVGTLQAALVSAGDELRPVIVWALGACGEGAKPALPLLEGLVQGRLAAGGHLALALARVGGVDQAGLIRKILGHHGGEAAWNMERAGAAFALGWCGDLESLDELTRLVEQGLSGQAAPGGDPVFLGAVQGLGQLGAFYGSVEQKGTIITLLGRVIEDEIGRAHV